MLKEGALLARAPQAVIFTRLPSEHTTLDNIRRAVTGAVFLRRSDLQRTETYALGPRLLLNHLRKSPSRRAGEKDSPFDNPVRSPTRRR